MRDNKPIITGRKVNINKVELAKKFRRNMTPQENKLWERLRNDQLGGYHFRRQQLIDGFIVDFYCNSLKLVIEVDGDIHRLQREYDEDREIILKSEGIEVLRVANEEIENNIEKVLQDILLCCERRKRTK
jgi:very-short-patch-repair endonuclease